MMKRKKIKLTINWLAAYLECSVKEMNSHHLCYLIGCVILSADGWSKMILGTVIRQPDLGYPEIDFIFAGGEIWTFKNELGIIMQEILVPEVYEGQR